MREIVVTNDLVLISFVESLLKDAGVMAAVADANFSAVEGSINLFPRRILVLEEQWEAAARVLADADLEQWISR